VTVVDGGSVEPRDQRVRGLQPFPVVQLEDVPGGGRAQARLLLVRHEALQASLAEGAGALRQEAPLGGGEERTGQVDPHARSPA